MIDVNVAQMIVLGVTAFSGVAIGFAGAPLRPGSNARSHCVVRRYTSPDGIEILYESRTLRAAARYRDRYRADYLKDGITIALMKRSAVDNFNADAMSKSAFWDQMEDLGVAWNQLQRLQQQPQQSPPLDAAAQGALLAVVQRVEALHEQMQATGELVLQLHEQRTSAPERGEEPGSVMPQLAPTEAMSIPVSANLFGSPFVLPPPEPSHQQFVPDPHPTAARGVAMEKRTTTVVMPLVAPTRGSSESDGPTG